MRGGEEERGGEEGREGNLQEREGKQASRQAGKQAGRQAEGERETRREERRGEERAIEEGGLARARYASMDIEKSFLAWNDIIRYFCNEINRSLVSVTKLHSRTSPCTPTVGPCHGPPPPGSAARPRALPGRGCRRSLRVS